MIAKERYLIVGLGSIGKRHLECLRHLRPDSDITVWRQHSRNAAIPLGANRVVFDIADALAQKPFAAIIANPSTKHVETAIKLANKGIHLLIEKPISDSMTNVDSLMAICYEKKLTLEVGYVLRFNHELIAFRDLVRMGSIGNVLAFRAEVGQFLPDWRPNTDYRQGVSANKKLGGGALLELSHELDYVAWVFGEPLSVAAQLIRSGALESDVEDMVDVIIKIVTEAGNTVTGTIHMDMLQRAPVRYCRAIGVSGTLEWNGIERCTRKFNPATGKWVVLASGIYEGRNEIFIRQLQNFLTSSERKEKDVAQRAKDMVALRMIEAIRTSSREEKTIYLQ